MKNRWVVLQHVAWEGPGIIAQEAARRGYEVDVRRLDREDALPKADHIHGLVVMGGPLGAYEEASYPFLKKECELLATMARIGRPVLGVCLGAQLLAKALGAKVFPGHAAEIGFGSAELTAAAQRDPLFAGADDTLPVFHWHGDTFTLPDGAELLASSSTYAHQAFRFGNLAYGLQFHIEPDASTWAEWRPHLPEGLIDKASLEQQAIEATGKRVIARFFDRVMAADA
jgi:GMP synthase (glutamine-hydrolysing)